MEVQIITHSNSWYHPDQTPSRQTRQWLPAICLSLVRDDRSDVRVCSGRQVDLVIFSPDGEFRAAFDFGEVLCLAEAWPGLASLPLS